MVLRWLLVGPSSDSLKMNVNEIMDTSSEGDQTATVSNDIESFLAGAGTSEISEFDLLEKNQSTPIQINAIVSSQSTILQNPVFDQDLTIASSVTIDDISKSTPDCSIESKDSASEASTDNEIFNFDKTDDLSTRLAKRIQLRRLDDVELVARRYAETCAFDVQKTIDHWNTRKVTKAHLVFGTRNKKIKTMAFKNSTGRASQNIDILGVQRNEMYQVNLPCGTTKDMVNDRFERHPFALGEKILLPVASDPDNNIMVGSVVDWRFDVDEQKFYYDLNLNDCHQNDNRQSLEYPECRIFKKFDLPRIPDADILQAKGYTLVSCRRFKRTNIVQIDTGDGDIFMVACQDKEYNGWYGVWQIDEFGNLVHKNLNLLLFFYYEQLRPHDKVQKSFLKIGLFPMKFLKDSDPNKKLQKIMDRINEPTALELCFLRRTVNKCRRYGGIHRLLVDQQLQLHELLVKLKKTGYDLSKYADVLRTDGAVDRDTDLRGTDGAVDRDTDLRGTCQRILIESDNLVDETSDRNIFDGEKGLHVAASDSIATDSANDMVQVDNAQRTETDNRRIQFLEAQINQLQCQLDAMNQRIQKGESEVAKIKSDTGNSGGFGVGALVNETLFAIQEEFEQNYIQVNDLPKLFRKIEKLMMKRIGTVAEDLSFDTARQIGIAIRIYNETGRIIEGFEDVVNQYMNVDLDSVKIITAYERDDLATRGRILEPSNQNLVLENDVKEKAVNDSTFEAESTTDADVAAQSNSPQPGTSQRSPGLAGRFRGRASSTGDVTVAIDRDEVKRFLINKIMKSNTIPFEKKHLENLDEQTLSAIGQMCSPERIPPTAGHEQPAENTPLVDRTSPMEEMSPIDIDLSLASPLSMNMSNNERTPDSIRRNMDVDPPTTPQRRVHVSPDPDYEPPDSWVSPNFPRNGPVSNAQGLVLRSGNVLRNENSPQPTSSRTPIENNRTPRQLDQVIVNESQNIVNSPQSLSDDSEYTDATTRRQVKTIQRRLRKAINRQEYLEREIEKCKRLNLLEPVRLLEKEKSSSIKTIRKSKLELMAIRHETHNFDGPQTECPECGNSHNRLVTPSTSQRRLSPTEEPGLRNPRAPSRRTVRPTQVTRRNHAESSSDDEILVVEERRQYRKKKEDKTLKKGLKFWETCRNSRKRARFQDSSGSTTTPERGADQRRNLAQFQSPYALNRGTNVAQNNGGQNGTNDNVASNDSTGNEGTRQAANVSVTDARSLSADSTRNPDDASFRHSRQEETIVNQLLYGYDRTSTQTTITQTPSRRSLVNEFVEDEVAGQNENEPNALIYGLDIENPTDEMRSINRAVVDFENRFAKTDRRCVRFITRSWRDSDLEVVSERAGLFNWRCTRRLIAGRLGKLDKVKSRIESINIYQNNVRDVERDLNLKHLVGIWQWMVALFPPPPESDAIDTRYYLTRIRDKVQSNTNSEKFRIRQKTTTAHSMPRMDLTHQFLQISSPSSAED